MTSAPRSRAPFGALATLALSLMPFAAQADVPKVAASIAPVHSLVAAIMEGVGEPELIMPGATSPHGAALSPGQARSIQNAGIVFWIGNGLETHMTRPLASIAKGRVVALGELEGLTERKPSRSDDGEHDDHGHEKHADKHDHDDDHANDGKKAGHDHDEHEKDDKHAHEASETDDHAHDDGHDHAHEHGDEDMHVWMDPANARVMAVAIASALAEADAENAERYTANLKALEDRLTSLQSSMSERLAPVKGRGIVVFHDAYAHLVEPFGLRVLDVVTVSPDVPLGAARLRRVREELAEHPDTCLFAEPQFPDRILDRITEGTDVGRGTLDPLGASLEPGPGQYEALMNGLADALTACLSEQG